VASSGCNRQDPGDDPIAPRQRHALSNANHFGTSSPWTTWAIDFTHGFADADGDQRADIVGNGGAGGNSGGATNSVQVGLSTGNAFSPSTQWALSPEPLRLRADVDGDGRADGVDRFGSSVYVSLSRGSSFGSATIWTT
jgi:hypothetical protein